MEPRWEWIDTILGIIGGAVSTILGMVRWLGPKFTKMEQTTQALRNDTDKKINLVHDRITEHVEEIARLRAHREDDQRRLESIDKKLDRILDRIPR